MTYQIIHTAPNDFKNCPSGFSFRPYDNEDQVSGRSDFTKVFDPVGHWMAPGSKMFAKSFRPCDKEDQVSGLSDFTKLFDPVGRWDASGSKISVKSVRPCDNDDQVGGLSD